MTPGSRVQSRGGTDTLALRAGTKSILEHKASVGCKVEVGLGRDESCKSQSCGGILHILKPVQELFQKASKFCLVESSLENTNTTASDCNVAVITKGLSASQLTCSLPGQFFPECHPRVGFSFAEVPAGYVLWCRCTAEIHVLNDEYTRQWRLTMHINWRDNSSVAANVLTWVNEKLCWHRLK